MHLYLRGGGALSWKPVSSPRLPTAVSYALGCPCSSVSGLTHRPLHLRATLARAGTGHMLLAAARAVGPQGRVLGVDLSPRMVEQVTAA